MSRTVVIDCFPESVAQYRDTHAVVAVDVIRATTTAVTAVSQGRRCFPVASLEQSADLAVQLVDPLLVGELGGSMPYGFDLTNSPAQIEERRDVRRPMILLSTSGTRVICAAGSQPMYVACLRNYRAAYEHLVDWDGPIAVIGAGARGEFREEDALCAAWIAEGLLAAGFNPANRNTEALVRLWSGAPVTAICDGNSAQYLRRTNQMRDLDFVLEHVDDLDEVYYFADAEIVPHNSGAMSSALRSMPA